MIAIIANPKARRFSIKKLMTIKEIFNTSYANTDIFYTEGPMGGYRIAKKIGSSYEIICSYGGDGTLNEVINGLVDTDVKLGILPCGTSDVFALELGLPRDAVKAAKLYLTPKYASVHLGMLNNRYFILMAGVGIDAAAVLDVNHRLKEYSGKLSYIISGIKSVKAFDKLISVETPLGNKLCYSVIASNTKKYGGNFPIFNKASCFEKNLYVCLFYSKKSLWGIVKSAIYLSLNLNSKLYECFFADEIFINSHFMPMQVDGDFAGFSPASIQATKKCIKVLI
ncbi:Transcription regulator [Desulfurella amilsii]|uniref:Transcription regulator n=1 Tax=Desulfurella amilsii TaxID=1562698 RepID=A0A1X4XXE3_9BACT|nr:YegS/Rv2252/BmrU family lipid kinase [Desulfurella amilsii]OSS42210.1 Transcription regulator [Desulfurella amilsii]